MRRIVRRGGGVLRHAAWSSCFVLLLVAGFVAGSAAFAALLWAAYFLSHVLAEG